jgi:hypothetical protein
MDVAVKGDAVYLNQSRASDFLNCEVLYYLNYEFRGGLRGKSKELALELGSAYHAGIAAYYKYGRSIDKGQAAAREYLEAVIAEVRPLAEERKIWNEATLMACLMIERYHIRYKDEPLEILAAEVEGDVQIGDSPHHLIFRTDALVKQYQTIGLIDHKTKGKDPQSLEIARLHMGIQPSSYVYGVRKKTGMPVSGMWIRYAIKKPKYEASRMHREEWTGRSDQALDRFEKQMIMLCDRILELRKSGKWLHNWNHCTTYGECRKRAICLHHFNETVLNAFVPRDPDYVDEAIK